VRNEGTIVANLGTVALAAGDRVTLDMVGDGLINVSVDQAALNASAVNTGILEANGGKVLMTARAAGLLLDTVINTSGTIRAHRMAERDGIIVLDGNGPVEVSGILEASGTSTINSSGGISGGTPIVPARPEDYVLSFETLTKKEGINWQSFNISTTDEAVQFVTASGSVALNSVVQTANTATTPIYGSLMLTNQVGLVAPLQHNVIGTGVLVPTDAFFSLK